MMLSRINLVLRHALQEQNRPNFGRVQQSLVAEFIDDNAFRRLQDQFAHVSMDDRPIFLPLAVLNIMRLVLVHSQRGIPESAVDNPAVRHSIGSACLMMNDLLVSEEEARRIKDGEEKVQRLELLVQLLPSFELANPPTAQHLLFRYQVIFKTLLAQDSVRRRIARQCRGFDLDREFLRITTIPLERWFHVVFAMYIYYLQGGDLFHPHPEFSFIEPKRFIAESQISEYELNAVIKTLAGGMDELRTEIAKKTMTDVRFDFVPFRSFPLLSVEKDRIACLDLALLLEKVHSGIHWLMHDSYPSSSARRDDLFKAWGILFEEYVHWLLQGMEAQLPVSYLRSPQWVEGGECFDGVLLTGGVVAAFEFKGGFLARNARYSGRTKEFVRDCDVKFAEGCRQLASKIGSLFAKDSARRRRVDCLPTDQTRAVVPVLVLQDHILRAPFLNWYLNIQFREELSRYPLLPRPIIRPLSVINIHELETMVNSAEAAGFDMIYALHHRTIRDDDMLSSMQEWLLQFPNYGRGTSRRAKSVYDELQDSMFSYLFPAVRKQNDQP